MMNDEFGVATLKLPPKVGHKTYGMSDASADSDNVLDNFEQIFKHYSSYTIRKNL